MFADTSSTSLFFKGWPRKVSGYHQCVLPGSSGRLARVWYHQGRWV